MEEEITERDEAIGKGIIKQIQRLIFPAIWIYNGATHTHTQLLAMVLYTFSPS
jgi:hypothetical protein